jgi:ankyrin repeat protein
MLLEHGADVTIKNNDSETALILASMNEHIAIVKMLLDHKANPNTKDGFFGYTPLLLASENGHTPIVKMLLEHGADVTIKNNDSETAFDVAKTDKIKQLLLDAQKRQSK